MNRNEGDRTKAYEQFYNFTLDQINKWGVKYHQLILGKPSGDFYIDDKGMNANDFFK
jgi:hypothetical protein